MRIWDVEPRILCRKHLLGEHRELHGLWNILIMHKRGYSNHPETRRWVGKEKALYNRHEQLVQEMKKRGYAHFSPLRQDLAKGNEIQNIFIHTIEEQKKLLQEKRCECIV